MPLKSRYCLINQRFLLNDPVKVNNFSVKTTETINIKFVSKVFLNNFAP